MRKLVEQRLEDLSTKEVFLFRVSCDLCATSYTGKTLRFSKAGIIPPTQEKRILFEAVYDQEYIAARQTSIRAMAEHLNFCPICKRIVCNRCFLICEDLDMCRQCAAHLQERGSPVLADTVDAENSA